MIFNVDYDKKINKGFLNSIKSKLKFIIMLNLRVDYAKKYSKELSEMFGEDINCYRLIKMCSTALKLLINDNGFYIILPKGIYYPNTNIDIETIMKVIEFGTLELTPYPIMRKSIRQLKKNLDRYYNYYLRFGW